MIVALGRATVQQATLFGLNSHRPPQEQQRLVIQAGGQHAPGEMIQAQHVRLPQIRQTWTTLGCQPENCWGYLYGINEHQVAVGFSHWGSRLSSGRIGLLGTDLVRVTLERASTAMQAVDLLTDLIRRQGQSRFAGYPSATEEDHIFLVADGREAFVIEAADTYWALQEIRSVRAVSDVSVIRQDWDRICPGLAQHVSDRGWWECDGNKLDFGALGVDPVGRASALRRWGRATFMLESQNGHIDLNFCRQLLADHYDDTHFEVDPLSGAAEPVPICRHATRQGGPVTATNFLVELHPQRPAAVMAWCSFGPPCLSLSLPLVLLPETLPAAYHAATTAFRSRTMWQAARQLQQHVGLDAERWELVRERLVWLQARIDQDAEEFLHRAAEYHQRGRSDDLHRAAHHLMRSHLEQFDNLLDGLLHPEAAPVTEEIWN
jgi:dipeptidase